MIIVLAVIHLLYFCFLARKATESAWGSVQGVRARQHDAWDIGVITSDDFGNAYVLYPETLQAVQKALTWGPGTQPYIPVVTGFLGRGQLTGKTQVVQCTT